jgi:hypothetical protein
MLTTKRFLAIFTGTPAAMEKWNQLGESERKQREARGLEAWNRWASEHAAEIVDHGAPLGKTKRVDAQGIADIRNAMAAYVVLQAESHEAAAKLFEGHPHFTIFPGDGVEIMACLPMPSR